MARSILRLLVVAGALAVVGPLPDMLQADELFRSDLNCATSRHTCERNRCSRIALPEEVIGINWHEEICRNDEGHLVLRSSHPHPNECCWFF